MIIVENILAALSDLGSQSFCIAYSGGMDSHVLLHALMTLRRANPAMQLKAIHINHALNPKAAQWAEHCQRVCHDLDLEYAEKTIDACLPPGNKQSPEAYAREERYKAFSESLQENECLLTAHHKDDQAETLLLQLFRGAGPKGLSSMPMQMPLAKGQLLRPLLPFTREELETYAKHHKLNWIEDDSNTNTDFDRNYIRHELIPIIHKRWPAATETISRTANHCADASELLDQLADQDYQSNKGTTTNTLSVPKLLALAPERQSNVLRYWLRLSNLPTPSQNKISQIQQTVLKSKPDATPEVKWKGGEVRRFQNEIYAMTPLPDFDSNTSLKWDLKQRLILPANLGSLTFKPAKQTENAPTHLTIKFRQGGERCQLPNRKGTHSLKKLFQEWNIPTWQRDRIPLIYQDKILVAIPGYYTNDAFVHENSDLIWKKVE